MYVLSIPNNVASEAIVHNYNYPNEPCKSSLILHIDFNHFPGRVEKILLDAVLATKGILTEPKPSVKFRGFSYWAADYSVAFFVNTYDERSTYNTLIWKKILD